MFTTRVHALWNNVIQRVKYRVHRNMCAIHRWSLSFSLIVEELVTALFVVRSALALAKGRQTNTVRDGVLALLIRNSKTVTVSKYIVHFFQSESLGLGYEKHDKEAAEEGEGLLIFVRH